MLLANKNQKYTFYTAGVVAILATILIRRVGLGASDDDSMSTEFLKAESLETAIPARGGYSSLGNRFFIKFAIPRCLDDGTGMHPEKALFTEHQHDSTSYRSSYLTRFLPPKKAPRLSAPPHEKGDRWRDRGDRPNGKGIARLWPILIRASSDPANTQSGTQIFQR